MPRLQNASIVRIAFFGISLACGPTLAAPPDTSVSDLALLVALTWGATPTSFTELRAQGREVWLSVQLRPQTLTGFPGPVQAQIDSAQSQGALIDRIAALDVQARAENGIADPEAKKVAQLAYQSALNDILRQS